ncbi:MAG: succinate dehydrogenase, hydrophobic membrane anchor protein [Rhodobacteraceae bacterium]|nr:succinate dehydrogenase, hydrophobic membrane anchor protein [Paracoccaceae bacterium]
MAFLTDRKRAIGLGSAKEGTEHFWSMTVSSVALLILVPLFVFTFGPMLGEPHADVVAYFARPFPALVAGLTIAVGFMHFKNGVQVLIEDYVHGLARKVAIIAMICLSYAAAATGVFAIARIAL